MYHVFFIDVILSPDIVRSYFSGKRGRRALVLTGLASQREGAELEALATIPNFCILRNYCMISLMIANGNRSGAFVEFTHDMVNNFKTQGDRAVYQVKMHFCIYHIIYSCLLQSSLGFAEKPDLRQQEHANGDNDIFFICFFRYPNTRPPRGSFNLS